MRLSVTPPIERLRTAEYCWPELIFDVFKFYAAVMLWTANHAVAALALCSAYTCRSCSMTGEHYWYMPKLQRREAISCLKESTKLQWTQKQQACMQDISSAAADHSFLQCTDL